jgi:hypothetical protein
VAGSTVIELLFVIEVADIADAMETVDGRSPEELDSAHTPFFKDISREARDFLEAGNMPADCSQSPLIGRWAGKRVLVQGDYAENDDIPGWQGPPLSRLYHSATSAAKITASFRSTTWSSATGPSSDNGQNPTGCGWK